MKIIPIIAVYSESKPAGSNYIRDLLSGLGVQPMETHRLEDYIKGDSPKDVGLYINGSFRNVEVIRGDEKGIRNMLRESKTLKRAA